MDQVTQQLYEQTMDTQEGVVYLLLEEMAQQRIKEYLLAYALLLIKGERFTQHNAWTCLDSCSVHLRNSTKPPHFWTTCVNRMLPKCHHFLSLPKKATGADVQALLRSC